MCGIAGIFYFSTTNAEKAVNTDKILNLLKHRGPDNQSFADFKSGKLFHSRLEIVDTTEASNQPFCNADKTNTLVFNGEIFNYQDFQKEFDVKTTGDVEILFKLLQTKGKECLNLLNGFFAFGFYDEKKNNLLVARDRSGIKPLYYYSDTEKFIFASELKPLLELAGAQEIDPEQLYSYFRLNYCAGSKTIFKNVYRLLPGHLIEVNEQGVRVENWYTVDKLKNSETTTESTNKLSGLLEDAVKLRLHADVPVGTFLSGGIDSSIISALAKKHKADLNTFSIGFSDEKYFDETHYSELVATHIKSNHRVFKLKEDDFLQHIDAFLASIDEPFADSSAFNFYMLSMYTRQHVKVALSGDGADELFKGYNKHKALLLGDNSWMKVISGILPKIIPGNKSSRNSMLQNKVRQLKKFNTLGNLSSIEKQQFLASISNDTECQELLIGKHSCLYFNSLFETTAGFRNFDLEDSFDLQTVLADDMLVKADRFSMQHGVEIRNPFLDYRVVEFALNLPLAQKINKTNQKIILKESFSDLLPKQIFTRSKKGFELPLQKWLSGQLKNKLENDWLNSDKLIAEGFLTTEEIKNIKNQLFSDSPGDSAARLWAIIIFESWLQNFKDYIKH
jgi:asparagine synthase (glutamine-hydrolysing)